MKAGGADVSPSDRGREFQLKGPVDEKDHWPASDSLVWNFEGQGFRREFSRECRAAGNHRDMWGARGRGLRKGYICNIIIVEPILYWIQAETGNHALEEE